MPGGGGARDNPAPPHNLEAEESMLGAMMVSEAAIDPVMGEARLNAEDFYRGRHGTIYAAIHELYERNEPVDALTVAELLRSQGKLEEVGGQDAINTLAATTPVPGNAGHYAQIVKQNAMLRRLLGAATADPAVRARARGRAAGSGRAGGGPALQGGPGRAGRATSASSRRSSTPSSASSTSSPAARPR